MFEKLPKRKRFLLKLQTRKEPLQTASHSDSCEMSIMGKDALVFLVFLHQTVLHKGLKSQTFVVCFLVKLEDFPAVTG